MKIPDPGQYMGIVETAVHEDVGSGDITTRALGIGDRKCEGHISVREDGVAAGLFVAGAVFRTIDPEVEFEPLVDEGALVRSGSIIAKVRGRGEPVLAGERTALNFLQRMSGIATLTYRFVKAVKGTKAVIKDTRKTTPGLRVLEKFAVAAGGGVNHRFRLDDAVLIKDNHIVLAGGISNAVKAARAAVERTMTIEVETQTIEDVREALAAGADIIMLDNMSLTQVEEAVKIIGGKVLVEVSGNVNLLNVDQYAAIGVDIISVGALTHSPDALDIGMDFIPE